MSQQCEPARSTPKLGPVLVTGGNGFIASHIIDKILEGDPSCEVHSLDINTSRNRHPNAHYHQGDISCLADVQRIMRTANPSQASIRPHLSSSIYLTQPTKASSSTAQTISSTLQSMSVQSIAWQQGFSHLLAPPMLYDWRAFYRRSR